MAEESHITIDDTNIVAYLNYCGFKFSPYRKDNTGRIGFKVFGNVDGALSDYYGNSKVGVQDYVGCLKKVRGSMFLLKGMNDDDEHKIIKGE